VCGYGRRGCKEISHSPLDRFLSCISDKKVAIAPKALKDPFANSLTRKLKKSAKASLAKTMESAALAPRMSLLPRNLEKSSMPSTQPTMVVGSIASVPAGFLVSSASTNWKSVPVVIMYACMDPSVLLQTRRVIWVISVIAMRVLMPSKGMPESFASTLRQISVPSMEVPVLARPTLHFV
jgi:hypothetical protein